MATTAPATNWTEVNPRSLPEDIKTLYCDYCDARDAANEFREKFESALRPMLKCQPGKKVAFGYKWGKLSIAMVDDDRRPGKAALDLSALLRKA